MIRNRKQHNKNYEDVSLRISDLKNSIIHYQNDIVVINDRIILFKGLKNILIKMKRIQQNNKNMNYNRVLCDLCKIDIHRASYSRHLKCKKHLENMAQNKVIVPRKNLTKRVVKDDTEVSHTNVENHYYFTDRILKIAYIIDIDNHHSKNANSIITITSKFDNIGIDINYINNGGNESCIC